MMATISKPSSMLSFEEVPVDGRTISASERGTDQDVQDMTRMGKRQSLRVRLSIPFHRVYEV